MKREMLAVLGTVALALGLSSLLHCAGFGIAAAQPEPYTGKSTVPQIKLNGLWLHRLGCDDHRCTYHAGLNPRLNNPRAMRLPVKEVICTYFLDGKLLGKAYPASLELPARSTRELRGFDFLFDTSKKFAKVSAFCTADFGFGFPFASDQASADYAEFVTSD